MVKVFIGIGSNIDKHIHIPQVIEELAERFGDIQVSPVYQTAAEGFSGDDFYNLVVGVDTDMAAKEVRLYLRELEAQHSRVRDSKNQFISRTIDLDQLLYGNQIINSEGVHVPSSDITNYAFVLKPLTDIAAHSVHPVLRVKFIQLWEEFDKNQTSLKQVDIEYSSTDIRERKIVN